MSQSKAIAPKAASQIIDLTEELEPVPSSKLSYENIFTVSVIHTDPYLGENSKSVGVYDTVEDANRAARRYLEGEHGEDIDWDAYEDNVDEDDCVHITAEGFESETFRIDVEMRKVQKRRPHASQAEEPTVPPQSRATTAKMPISKALGTTNAFIPNWEDVYVVSCTYTIPYVSNETNVTGLHSDLNEANEAARRYLDDKNPGLSRWDEYSEKFNCDEGGIHIKAANMDTDSYIMTVQRKKQERKQPIQQIAPLPPRPPSPELAEIFLVTVEKRKYVCGSNEDGDIESVEVQGAFKALEDAEDFAEQELEELMRHDEWEREEGDGNDILVLVAREYMREEMLIVGISQIALE